MSDGMEMPFSVRLQPEEYKMLDRIVAEHWKAEGRTSRGAAIRRLIRKEYSLITRSERPARAQREQ